MTKRILTAIVALGVLAPFLIFSDTNLLLVLSGVLSGFALFEILDCVGLSKNLFITLPTLAVSSAAVIMTRLIGDTNRYFVLIFLLFFIYIVYMMAISVLSRGTVPLSDTAIATIASIYIIFGFCSVVLLRDLSYGRYIYLIAFLVPWMCDAGSYFIGTKFGRRKLIPDVSPKKTVEGAVGGIAFGTVSAIIYGFIINRFFSVGTNYIALLTGGFIISILSEMGDLIASHIKRHYSKKDYGTVFPGHGGVLDRFDSIIATAPFLYFLCFMIPAFEIFF
ncbi:MAG: phosphatidate cytidylyltransferase [Eubacteriales bacterium]|jgi:phosphatidate cytidylyltransferase|nr:phosphatidate cytidylyltransferase [Eubacteriales bacterium]